MALALKQKHVIKAACLIVANCMFLHVYGQKKIKVNFHSYLNDTIYSIKSKNFNSTNHINSYCSKLLTKSYNKGYLSSSIDSIHTTQNKTNVIYRSGEKYFLKEIQANDIYNGPIVKFSKSFRKNKTYSIEYFDRLKYDIIKHQQNKGFPFPTIQSETIIDSTNNISHYFTIKKGLKFTYSKINLTGFNRNELKYISNVTGIKQGALYKKKDIDNFESSISSSGFYTLDSVNFEYSDDKLIATPFIKKLKLNRISALIGMQTSENEKTSIAGSADLHIKNALKFGEEIHFNWKKINEESQLLNIKFKYPYIFNSPVGVISELRINKMDSSFNKQLLKLGLSIPISHTTEMSTYYTNISNNTLANNYKNNNSEQNLYGLTFNYSNTDNIHFPQKGIISIIDIMTGGRKTKNSEKEFILQNQNDINIFFKALNGSIKLRNFMGFIANDSIQENELFQLGGTTTIRGFNENSIFSKNFNITSLEYRFIIAKNSHLSLFYDNGIFQIFSEAQNNISYKQSIGAGIKVETKAGILTVIYAIGKHNSESFNVSNAKIHIGYIATF